MVCVLAVVSASLGCTRPSSETDVGAARVTLGPCEPSFGDARCGVLRVPEDPSAPGGRTLEIGFAVLPSTAREPELDPVFLLAGGPGQGAASLAPMIGHKFKAILAHRDMVFVDLRGTGRSNPLICAIEDPRDLSELLGAEFHVEKLDGCLADYEVDTAAFTTPRAMDDVDAIREALGYEQINLFGISYGTRAALVYMRRHGDRVRSAVLDGVAPLDVALSMEMPRNSEAALGAVLDDCRAQPSCDAAFPDLERKLDEVLRDLDAGRVLREVTHPRTGELLRIDVAPAGFLGALRLALYSGESAALLPLVIDRAHGGDFNPVAALLLRAAGMSETMSAGLYFSVSCAEDLYGNSEAERAKAEAGLRFFDSEYLERLGEACARWPHASMPAEYWAPVVSDVPTLLLSGRYDPATPPAMGERVAARLSHGRHVIAEGASHGVWHQGCALELAAELFATADPDKLDPSCLEAVGRPPLFLSAAGPRPLPVEASP